MIETLANFGFVIAGILTLLAAIPAHRKWKRDMAADTMFRIESERAEIREKARWDAITEAWSGDVV